MRSDAAFLLVGWNARIERRTPGVANDIDAFRRLAASRHRPHDVGEIRGVDILVNHHHDTRHVAVRRGNQSRALGVAVVALAQRDDGHELRHVLPRTDHVGDSGGVKIAPDRRRPERQTEMKAWRLHGRRTEQDRIVAVMDGTHFHHRAGTRRGRIVSGELAERPFRQGHLGHRQQAAFKDHFRMRRKRKAGLRAVAYFDRRPLMAPANSYSDFPSGRYSKPEMNSAGSSP